MPGPGREQFLGAETTAGRQGQTSFPWDPPQGRHLGAPCTTWVLALASSLGVSWGVPHLSFTRNPTLPSTSLSDQAALLEAAWICLQSAFLDHRHIWVGSSLPSCPPVRPEGSPNLSHPPAAFGILHSKSHFTCLSSKSVFKL